MFARMPCGQAEPYGGRSADEPNLTSNLFVILAHVGSDCAGALGRIEDARCERVTGEEPCHSMTAIDRGEEPDTVAAQVVQQDGVSGLVADEPNL